MALMDFFSKNTKNSPAPAVASPVTSIKDGVQQPLPATLQTESNQATGANGVVPVGAAQSPLDEFANLWQPNKDDKGNVIPVTNLKDKHINVDANKVREAAGKVDFRKVVTPELMQAAMAGGEAGVTAMMEAMNNMAQTVYAQSAITTSSLVEQALQSATDRFSNSIPDQIKKHQVKDTLRTENPLFSNPAVEPMLNMLEQQFTAKYPNATVTEIKDSAKRYLESFAGAVTGSDKQKVESIPAGEDWGKFFDQ